MSPAEETEELGELVSEIVALYAEHGAGGTGTHPDYLALARERKKDSGFAPTVNRVKVVARKLEERLEGRAHAKQVKRALQTFNTHKQRPRRQRICRALTRRRYAPHWSQAQRKYYEEASEKLRWGDYFLSFTNYNPVGGAIMHVNREHMALIRAGLVRSIGPPETEKANLLAELLNTELRNGSLAGYYFPHERGADDVEAELMQQASESFVFVQLVHNTMFEKLPNYCLDEFNAASGNGARKMLFVMSAPFSALIEQQRIDERMHGWHATIQKPDVVELEPVATPARARKVLLEIKDRVVDPVIAARNELYENVPE